MRFATLISIATLATAACATNPAPVAFSADPEGRQLLMGNWGGEYFTADGGRVGSIVFNFGPEDTLGYAHGDVVMEPRFHQYTDRETGISAPEEVLQLLSIEFVHVNGHAVTGSLVPYRDPETGEMLNTTFEGSIEGDRISGALITVHSVSGKEDVGTWEIFRK